MDHYWRNRISFGTSEQLENLTQWRWVVQKRVAPYFRLYTSILVFSMYLLVSHRNMISIYDMSKEKLARDEESNELDNVAQVDR